MAKRAASAFWLWLGENRASLVETHGLEGKKASDISKKAGEVWKAIDQATKNNYEDLAATDKQRYQDEVQTVGKRVRMPMMDTSTGKKVRRDTTAPKQPLSGFFMWAQDTRENSKKLRSGCVPAKDVSYEAWKGVSEAIKKSYEDKAAQAREQYKKDLDVYHLQRASCRDPLMYVHNQWSASESSMDQGGDMKDTDMCECGEKLNGVRFCEQCGVENPHHKDASTPSHIVSNGTNNADSCLMDNVSHQAETVPDDSHRFETKLTDLPEEEAKEEEEKA